MNLQEAGIQKRAATALRKRKIYTVNDLLRTIPRKYYDYREPQFAKQATPDSHIVVSGVLENIEERPLRNNPSRTWLYGQIRQDDMTPVKIMFFAGTFRLRFFEEMQGQRVAVCGKLSFDEQWGYSIANPDVFMLEADFKPMIWRVYTNIKGVSDSNLRDMIRNQLPAIQEPLEQAVVDQYKNFPSYKEALYGLHYPKDEEDIRRGKRRLLWNDLLYFHMALQKTQGEFLKSECQVTNTNKTRQFIKSLPFALTEDQNACIQKIEEMARNKTRMNVLLQGDVGCGKTITVVAGMFLMAENGYQSILMAPRTTLAQQHFLEIKEYAEKTGYKAVFLHAGLKASERKEIVAQIENKEADIIVGTHSCLSDGITYPSLGLLVIDEEHLFGVNQKEKIQKQASNGVHTIAMSATPIPRSIANILYGDHATLLQIRQKPAGRKDIITRHLSSRTEAIPMILQEIQKGNRVYIVCPAIEESEETEIVSVEEVQKAYAKELEPKGIHMECVHGNMKNDEIANAMHRFKTGQAQVLLSTTVIEVGIDVPEATIMLIEQADRFGLASMHQLRGRVGRSDRQSYCLLLAKEPNERIETMLSTNDGFIIAENDLQQRGTGNLIGSQQSGMNAFISMVIEHPELSKEAKKQAHFCLKNGYGKALFNLYLEHQQPHG